MIENESEDGQVIASQYGKYRLISFENINKIDLYNVREMKEIFLAGNEEGIIDWIVDLSKITHIDSSGLGGLANQGMLLNKKLTNLFVLSPNSGVKHLFGVTGFNRIFTVIPDLSVLTI